ncbi:hypothetical protein QUF72_09200 [Desulfobacterales bacterium HSG2]|nr:hypothetical protein [Desulfobacterales bacterium HSG2]
MKTIRRMNIRACEISKLQRSIMSLEEKLKKASLNRKKKDSEIDWDKRRLLWTEQVGILYGNVEKWLKRYIEKNYISVHFYEIALHEEHIGKYSMDVLELDLGEPSVVFRPVGTNMIGACGRVDWYVSGHLDDKRMLILRENDESQGFQWELWKKRHRRPFNRDTLEETLEEWLACYDSL